MWCGLLAKVALSGTRRPMKIQPEMEVLSQSAEACLVRMLLYWSRELIMKVACTPAVAIDKPSPTRFEAVAECTAGCTKRERRPSLKVCFDGYKRADGMTALGADTD